MSWRRFRVLVRGLSMLSVFANAMSNRDKDEVRVVSDPKEADRLLKQTLL